MIRFSEQVHGPAWAHKLSQSHKDEICLVVLTSSPHEVPTTEQINTGMSNYAKTESVGMISLCQEQERSYSQPFQHFR